jgi:acetolactate synthase I/II/III large subunit
MAEINGAEIIVRILHEHGIKTLSGIPGGANLPLYDALARDGRIRHVLARHEQGAGFIAQGMARVSGKPAVCLATSGPGATNVLTAIADANLDSIPVICVTGQAPKTMLGTDAFQEVNTQGMASHITKGCFFAESAAQLLEILPEAFHLAQSGRPGPVLIDVPKDVQMECIEVAHFPKVMALDTPTPVLPSALEQAAALIDRAKRPVLCLGGGVIHADASAAAAQLAEKADLPVTTTLMGLGAIPSEHPLNVGMLGMHGSRQANWTIEGCDLFIAVGTRFGDRSTGKVAQFCPNAEIIHIDIDACELGKIKKAHCALQGDAKEVLEAMLPKVRPQERSEWRRHIADLCPPEKANANDLSTHADLIRAAARIAGPSAIVTTDVGQHQMWTAQCYPFARSRHWLTSGGLGTMGFGIPAAIGAALERPEAPVLCFTGDGSCLMNIQELATMVDEQVNVKIILMNNHALGLVHQQQTLFYEERTYGSNFQTAVDFAAVARGFGMTAHDLDTASNPHAMLREAIERPGPCLIHAGVDVAHRVYPMVPPGEANRNMLEAAHEKEGCLKPEDAPLQMTCS